MSDERSREGRRSDARSPENRMRTCLDLRPRVAPLLPFWVSVLAPYPELPELHRATPVPAPIADRLWLLASAVVEQRVSLVTLGVSDYARARTFYEALGWSVALDLQETAFFQANGVILVLWARDKLADDVGIPDEGARWGGVALAHNVRSPKPLRGSGRPGSCRFLA